MPEDRGREYHRERLREALREEIWALLEGELVTPPNCGLEIGDVVAYTETHVAATQQKARVRSIGIGVFLSMMRSV